MHFTVRLIKAILLLLGLASLAGPARPARAAEPPWQAQWIGLTSATTSAPNTWTCFRKTFELKKAAKTIPTRIAVDSKYWLWVNGELVIFEGGLKRGPNPQDTWYDEIDLGGKLKAGKNTIAILVDYWGVSGFSHNSSGKAGLVLEADLGEGEKLVSDHTWKALVHPAYGLAAVQPNYRLSERNICFDARKDIGEWFKPEYKDEGWKAPLEYGKPPVAPWNQLWKRPIPQWLNAGLADYRNSYPRVSDGKPIKMQLPSNIQVTPSMEIIALEPGLKITLSTDHKKVDFPCVHAEYITSGGLQRFEAPNWMNGQEVIYEIPAGIEIKKLQYRSTSYSTGFTGIFRCNDDFYNQLWNRARRTLFVNMRDNYFDCPDRERALWWGDVHIDLGMVPYCLDRRADQLTRKSIYDLINWQRADKTLYSPVPGSYTCELPAQMLASVGQYGFWTYYMNTGDKATMADAWPHVKDYLSLYKLGPDGLVLHRGKADAKPGNMWDWMDWGKDIDARVMDQAWYCLALQGAANMARLMGDKTEAERCEKVRQGVVEATNKAFWNGTAYRDPAYKGATDDRGNALAVVAGIAGKDKYPALRKVLAEEYHASPYMEKYCLEALFLMDAPDEALARMKKRYEPIMPAGLATLPELWTLKSGTVNHAWSGGPVTLLSQYVAGVAPQEAGYARYEVRPRLGSKLNQVMSQVLSPKGPLGVIMARDARSFEMTLSSPQGSVASVCIPKNPQTPYTRVLVTFGKFVNTPIWMKTGKPQEVPGIKFAGEDEQYLKFTVEPGEWALKAVAE